MKNNFFEIADKLNQKIDNIKQMLAPKTAAISEKMKLQLISSHLKKFSMVYILILLIAIFAGITDGTLLTPDTILLLLKNNSYITILAMGMLLVILSGNIDLSIGTLVGFLSILSITIYNVTGNIIVTFLLTTLIGTAFGILQGFLIGYIGIPAFIVTLGGFLAFQGAQLAYTKGASFAPTNIAGFQYGVIGAIPDIQIGNSFWVFSFLIFLFAGFLVVALRFFGYTSKKRAGLKTSKLWIFLLNQLIIFALFIGFGLEMALSRTGVLYYVIYVLIFIILFTFITQNTTFGRAVYAIGGNKKAAKLSGVNIKRTTFWIFVIMGALGGFSGVIFAGIAASATSNSGGDLALNVISAVFIGGASVYGGIGTVAGTVIGSSLLQVINQGMVIKNLLTAEQYIVKGIILIAAVGWDVMINKKNR